VTAPHPISNIIFLPLLVSYISFVFKVYVGPSKTLKQTITIVHILQGPRFLRKQKQPPCWSGGIMPPPFVTSMASNMETTSSISGRLSGLASQQRFITFAREFGQHLGISGLRFYSCNMGETLNNGLFPFYLFKRNLGWHCQKWMR
jgi:hypothetical protein